MTEFNILRSEIYKWSLSSDQKVFKNIETYAQNLLLKFDSFSKKITSLESDILSTDVNLSNTMNKFNSLGNSKFIDNV